MKTPIVLSSLAVFGAASLGAALLVDSGDGDGQTRAAAAAEIDPLSYLQGDALIEGLKNTPGCLGVDAAQTASGKNVIFAWFENKAGALAWYRSETHRAAMGGAFPDTARAKPLDGVPDDVPILAIASITMADKPHFDETPLPISQIAIELYTPVKGGIHLGGTFAPAGLKVQGLRDLTKDG